MRKVFLLLPAIFLLFTSPVVFAKDSERKVEVSTLKSNEVVNKDYFSFNERVEISGTVNGDVYAAGGIVLVDGKINGDLIVAGGQVIISGDVSQDVRVAGGQVSISGKIGRNLTIGGGNVDLNDKAEVIGSVVAGAGNLNLSGPIGKDIKAGAGNLTISNRVNGDIDVAVGVLRLTSKAAVGGNVTYLSKDDASIDSSAAVVGKVTKNLPKETEKEVRGKILGIISLLALIIKMVNLASLFIIGLLIIKFFPQFDSSVEKTLREKPWSSVGVGLVALILTPIIALALLISVIGLPIGGILLILLGISLFVARVFVIKLAGLMILERFNGKNHQVWSLLIGIILYGVLTIIPIIGMFVSFFTILLGFGALLINKRETYLTARSKNII